MDNNRFVMKEELRPFVQEIDLLCVLISVENNNRRCDGKKGDHDEMDYPDTEVERQLISEMNVD